MEVFGAAFVGREVLAVMDFHDPSAWLVGTLVSVGDDGEFVLDCEDGKRHYCWPLLHVELYEGTKA